MSVPRSTGTIRCRRCGDFFAREVFRTRAGKQSPSCRGCRVAWARMMRHGAESLEEKRREHPIEHAMSLSNRPGGVMLECSCGYWHTVRRNESIDQLAQLHCGAAFA